MRFIESIHNLLTFLEKNLSISRKNRDLIYKKEENEKQKRIFIVAMVITLFLHCNYRTFYLKRKKIKNYRLFQNNLKSLIKLY